MKLWKSEKSRGVISRLCRERIRGGYEATGLENMDPDWSTVDEIVSELFLPTISKKHGTTQLEISRPEIGTVGGTSCALQGTHPGYLELQQSLHVTGITTLRCSTRKSIGSGEKHELSWYLTSAPELLGA